MNVKSLNRRRECHVSFLWQQRNNLHWRRLDVHKTFRPGVRTAAQLPDTFSCPFGTADRVPLTKPSRLVVKAIDMADILYVTFTRGCWKNKLMVFTANCTEKCHKVWMAESQKLESLEPKYSCSFETTILINFTTERSFILFLNCV